MIEQINSPKDVKKLTLNEKEKLAKEIRRYIIDIVDSKVSSTKKNEITIDYDGNKVTYTTDKLLNFRHGYAISIHKAQGSEFPVVVMPIVNNFNRMLYNKLIYTGVTRAKKSLMIVGDAKCFMNGVMNDFVDYRKTTLKEFILEKYQYQGINEKK